MKEKARPTRQTVFKLRTLSFASRLCLGLPVTTGGWPVTNYSGRRVIGICFRLQGVLTGHPSFVLL